MKNSNDLLNTEKKLLLHIAAAEPDDLFAPTERASSFQNAASEKHLSASLTVYDTSELKDLEQMLDALWPEDEAMQLCLLPVLAANLKLRKKPEALLPPAEIWNYTL